MILAPVKDSSPGRPASALYSSPSTKCDRNAVLCGRMGMPTYAYRCEECGTTFEERQSMAEHEAATPRCPQCGGDKVVSAVSAFYAKTSKKS
jgi:putative FmdB family regulatory protein